VTAKPDQAGNTPPPIQGTVGFKKHQGHVFRLVCYTSADRWNTYREPMHRSLPSFTQLKDPRHLKVQTKKIKIAKLGSPMTLEQFNRKHPSTIELEALAVLNGIEASEVLPKGMLVKRVVGKDPPKN
ncbi:MAG: peptidase M48, partial [Acidobacteriota bacterium]